MSKPLTIDLEPYKTEELARVLAELLSIPAAFRLLLFTFTGVLVVALICNGVIVTWVQGSTLWLFLSSLYVLVVAAVLGFMAGMLRVASLILSRSEGLLKLILETSRRIALDYEKVKEGEKQIPSARELTHHVYQQIVVPAIGTAVTKSLGIFGLPLAWVYRKTIGRIVGRFSEVAFASRESASTNEPNAMETKAKRAMEIVANHAETTEARLTKVISLTGTTTRVLQRFLLRPLQFVFAMIALLALVPLGLVWYFAM
jgi:hypothetical protein